MAYVHGHFGSRLKIWLLASLVAQGKKNKLAERFFVSYQPLTFKSIKLGLAGVAIPQYLSNYRGGGAVMVCWLVLLVVAGWACGSP